MDMKKIALIVGALIVAGIAAFMAKSMFAAKPIVPAVKAAAVPNKGPEILVATRPLPVGTIIEPDSFRYQPWPKELIENAYYKKGEDSPASLAGRVVRTAVTAGQPLTKGSLVSPGDRGFLAAALGPGMRAVTVPVSAQAGVAGFVFPGDRVDLIMTQTVAGSDSDSGPALRAAETIVRNVRVLATDQRAVSEEGPAAAGAGQPAGQRVVKTFSTITLEVTPRIAEKVAVAQAIGQLSLALRSIADNTSELERAIASGEVKVPAGADASAERRMMIQVSSRPVDTDTTFVVGGDVSRFQRRSLPARKPAPEAAVPSAPMPPRPVPTVRVSRGNAITEVPVGGK
jgi:pilus assembly protein CpaB